MTAVEPHDPVRPLRGVRVVSLAEQYPGPYATLVLADLGADVVLVERPQGGDPARQFPHFFASLNRGKRSVCVDLKQADGVEVLCALVRRAEVVLDGYRPGTLARLGVSAEVARSINERIVYCSISGFGQDGPYRDRPAHDVSYQALAGMLEGQILRPGSAPTVLLADAVSGLMSVIAVLAGLLGARAGAGSVWDVSMLDGLISLLTPRLVPLANGGAPGLPPDPGYGVYECADGVKISLSIAHEDRFWNALCAVAGLNELAGVSHPQRVARRAEIVTALAAVFSQGTSRDWVSRLVASDVPCAVVHDLDQVLADEHLTARELLATIEREDGTVEQHLRQPLKVDGVRPGPTTPAPGLGEHTVQVLAEYGFADAEVQRLLAAGVIADPLTAAAGSGR